MVVNALARVGCGYSHSLVGSPSFDVLIAVSFLYGRWLILLFGGVGHIPPYDFTQRVRCVCGYSRDRDGRPRANGHAY